MRLEFLQYDAEAMAERYGLKLESGFLCFDFFGKPCRVSLSTGAAWCADTSDGEFREADFDESMTVYDILCWSAPDAAPSGELVNMNSLSHLTGAASAPSPKGFYSAQARLFDGKTDELSKALTAAGGTVSEGGDISAAFDVFCGLKVIFRFWNSDEDFDAQIQLLWDKNVLRYMHYETVWYAAGVLMDRIKRSMPTV